MRPLAKGAPPQTEYTHYRDALDELADRIGHFCSYCEQPIAHAPEIEHVRPKSLEPCLERSWDNLLLGCSSCNRIKGDKPVDLTLVAMPDTDNTFRGLKFFEGGKIEVSPHLTDEQAVMMGHVVELVKLGRHPDAEKRADQPTCRDKRSKLRSDVWDMATNALKEFEQNPVIANPIADWIVCLAAARGFFSVWMTVFCDHPDMLKRFIEAFPGTDRVCFDNEGQAVCRPGGRI